MTVGAPLAATTATMEGTVKLFSTDWTVSGSIDMSISKYSASIEILPFR